MFGLENEKLIEVDAEPALNGAFETIFEALAKGDKVQIAGFDTFKVRQ